MHSNRQLKLGAIIAYCTVLFNILTGLIYTPWVVHAIGVSDYGLFALATSLISMFALDFGLGSAVTRFLAKHKAENDLLGESRFLGVTFKLYFLIALLIFLVLVTVYFFIDNIYVELTPTEISKLKVVYLITGIYTVVSFAAKPIEGILTSNERFVVLKLSSFCQKLLVIICMISALFLGYGLYALVAINAIVGILKLVFQYIYIKMTMDLVVDFKTNDKTIYLSLFCFSLWSTIMLIAQRFVINISPSILAMTVDSTAVAVFAVGVTIESYTWTIANALGGLFLPKVSRMIVNNKDQDMRDIEDLVIRVGRIQLLIVGLIIIIFISMGKEFVYLWMGDDFRKSYYVASLLILPLIVTKPLQIANTLLVAKNEIKYGAYASIITAIISITMSIFLSKTYGVIGVAFSIFIANLFGKIVFSIWIYIKILKLNISRIFKDCYCSILLPMLGTCCFILAIQFFFPVQSVLYFIIKILLVGIIYFLLVWGIGLKKEEKVFLINLTRKGFKLFHK